MVATDRGPALEFGILGSLQVALAGRPLELRREKERLLLAMLLLHVNTVVPLAQLAAGLWEDSDAPRPPATLRVHVSRLRQALAAGGSPTQPIVSTARGYTLEVAPESVDAWRFDRLVEEGRRLAAAGEEQAAAETLAAALALWRGNALGDLPLTSATEPEIARLEEARAAALEDRVDADLRCGRHHELAGELEQLISEHPLRERLWGQRMVALYRSGRQAEALRAYEDLRVLLRDELGIRPGPAIQAVERAILAQDPVLVAPAGAGPRPGLLHEGRERGVPPPRSPRVRFPRRLLPAGLIPFAGRRAAFDTLVHAWKESAGGETRIVLLSGEAGIGKTRLAGEVARRAHDAGGTVLYGRCDEDVYVPFQPFVEALAQVVQGGPAQPELGRHAGELVRLLPELRAYLTGLEPPLQADPETERYRLFDAVAAWLGATAQEAGVLLVLDDLHWAGKPTLMLLRHLARSQEPMQLLVVGTYRETDVGGGHPLTELLADLRREPCFGRLHLDGLDAAEVREMVANAGSHGEEELADVGLALWSETAGNPFFVQEMLRSFASGPSDPGGRPGVPEGIREVVGRRVSRLGETAGILLGAASVIGSSFDFDVLVALSGLGEDEVLDALDEAVAASLLRESSAGSYEFVHGIVRSTLYEALGPARRARRHQRVGEALESVGRRDAPALATHFGLAGGSDARAADYAALAGGEALARLAFDRAVAWYAQAVESAAAAGTPPRRSCELLVGLGNAERAAGSPSSRETLLRAAALAEQLGDVELLQRAVLSNSRGFASSVGRRDEERVRSIESALSATGPGDSAARARLLSLLAVELMWDDPQLRRLELADEAVAMARRMGDEAAVLDASLAAQVSCTVPARVPRLVEELPEVVALAERIGDVQQVGRACFSGAHHCLEMDRLDLGERLLRRLGELAAELESPLFRWMDAHQRCRVTSMTGSGEDVELAAFTALQAGEDSGQPDRLTWFAAQMFAARSAQGRLGETVASVRAAIEATPAMTAWRATLPLALAAAGAHDEASAAVAVLADEPVGPPDILWLVGQSLVAEAVGQLGTAEEAARWYTVLAPYAGRIPCLVNVARPGVHHWLGVLAARAGRAAVAAGHFADARAQHERLGAPVWLARTELEWGRLLAAGGTDLDRARALLASARGGATRIGSADVVSAAGELLERMAG